MSDKTVLSTTYPSNSLALDLLHQSEPSIYITWYGFRGSGSERSYFGRSLISLGKVGRSLFSVVLVIVLDRKISLNFLSMSDQDFEINIRIIKSINRFFDHDLKVIAAVS